MWSLGNKRILQNFNKFLVLDICLCLSKAKNDNKRGRPFIISLLSTLGISRVPVYNKKDILRNASSIVNESFRNTHFI